MPCRRAGPRGVGGDGQGAQRPVGCRRPGEGPGDVVDIRRSGDDVQRGATPVADQAVFTARLAPVDRRRTGCGSPSFSRRRESRPRTCGSRRRQQICPEPNLSSSGRSCQAASLNSTYRMPCKQSLSDTGFAPGARSGQGGGSGSTGSHKSSSTIHGRVLTQPSTARSSDRTRATSALIQDSVATSYGGGLTQGHTMCGPRSARCTESVVRRVSAGIAGSSPCSC